MENDGMNDIAYEFGNDKALNEQLSLILNEACHVFHCHADGKWKEVYNSRE